MDLTGEKLSFEVARGVLRRLGEGALFFIARPGDEGMKPHYQLVWEGDAPEGLALRAEELLGEHHHYRLARELSQLGALTVQGCDNAGAFMQELCERHGKVLGDMKWESIVRAPVRMD